MELRIKSRVTGAKCANGEMRKTAVSGEGEGEGVPASCPEWRHGEKGLGGNDRSLRLAHIENFAKWVVKQLLTS